MRNAFLSIFVCLIKNFIYAQNAENFFVESYEWCANITNPLVKEYTSFKNFSPGNQIVDANLSSPVAIGENATLTVHLEIESKSRKGNWLHLFAISDDFCRIFQMYVGEFWYDIQRAAAIPPRTCPVPRGVYHISKYRLNFKKLKLQTFPFGRLKITMQTTNKITGKVLSCTIAIINNNCTS